MGDATNFLAAGIREAIERIEAALKNGVNLSNEFLLKGELLNKQGQLAEASQQEIHFEKEKKEDKAREASSVSYLVEQETKLNAAEKEKYSNFLALEYFSKKDLRELDNFYQHSWDKLSENGKDQMTDRLAEGIRRGDIKPEDLPQSIRERESDRLESRGVIIGNQKSPAQRAAGETSLHVEKSASNEADSRNTTTDEKKSGKELEEKSAAIDELAMGENMAPVNPMNLRSAGGASRSPS